MREVINTKEMLLSATDRRFSIDRPIHPIALPVLLLFLMIVDSATIFPLVESLFFQARLVSIIVVTGLCLLLEGLPFLAAQYFVKEEKTKRDQRIIWALVVGTVVLLIALFGLRWFSQEAAFSGGISHLNQVELTPDRIAMTILLGILPVLTSVAAFALSCFVPKAKFKAWLNDREDLKILDEMIHHLVCVDELEREVNRDIIPPSASMLEIEKRKLETIRKELKREVGLIIARKLATGDAVTQFCEGGLTNEKE